MLGKILHIYRKNHLSSPPPKKENAATVARRGACSAVPTAGEGAALAVLLALVVRRLLLRTAVARGGRGARRGGRGIRRRSRGRGRRRSGRARSRTGISRCRCGRGAACRCRFRSGRRGGGRRCRRFVALVATSQHSSEHGGSQEGVANLHMLPPKVVEGICRNADKQAQSECLPEFDSFWTPIIPVPPFPRCQKTAHLDVSHHRQYDNPDNTFPPENPYHRLP